MLINQGLYLVHLVCNEDKFTSGIYTCPYTSGIYHRVRIYLLCEYIESDLYFLVPTLFITKQAEIDSTVVSILSWNLSDLIEGLDEADEILFDTLHHAVLFSTS